MFKAMLATALLTVLAGSLHAEENTASPNSPPPVNGVASIDERGTLLLEESVTRLVFEPTLRYDFYLRASRVVIVPVPKTVTENRMLDLKTVQAFDKNGRKIAPAELKTILKTRSAVLISADGKKIDPSYLQDAQEGTVVLYLTRA